MKKFLFLITILLTFISCYVDTSVDTSEQVYQGEVIDDYSPRYIWLDGTHTCNIKRLKYNGQIYTLNNIRVPWEHSKLIKDENGEIKKVYYDRHGELCDYYEDAPYSLFFIKKDCTYEFTTKDTMTVYTTDENIIMLEDDLITFNIKNSVISFTLE